MKSPFFRSHILLLVLIVLLASFLRLYKLNVDPPGLYIDEASIGYNAYTILHTGKDEYGKPFPLLFKSFGDYKKPVYIYATALSIAVFGKNDFAVRFPSALAGILTVFLLFFFVKDLLEVCRSDLPSITIALLSSFLLAISTWHLQFSRGGFEVNFGLFFYLLGLWFFVKFYTNKKKTIYLFFSLLTLAFTTYVYHTYQVISPVLIVVLLTICWKEKLVSKNIFSMLFFLLFIVSLPLVLSSFNGVATTRFDQTSAFSQYITSNEYIKMISYPIVFLKNYISFFSPVFLFVQGDTNGRHQMTGWGLLYHWQIIFLLIGAFYMIKRKNNFIKTIFFLLFLVPIAGAIVVPSPHTLRSLPMIIPLSIIIAIGIYISYQKLIKYRVVFLSFLVAITLYESIFYLHDYYTHYPRINAWDWGATYEELILQVSLLHKHYPYIVMDKKQFDPIYFKFYNDQLHPIPVPPDWKEPQSWKGKTIYVRPYGIQTADKVIRVIYLPNHDIGSVIYEI